MSLNFTSTSYCASWRPDPPSGSTAPSVCASLTVLLSLGVVPTGEETSSAHELAPGASEECVNVLEEPSKGFEIRSAREPEGLVELDILNPGPGFMSVL